MPQNPLTNLRRPEVQDQLDSDEEAKKLTTGLQDKQRTNKNSHIQEHERSTYGLRKVISKEEKKALAETVDAIIDALDLHQAGVLSGRQLFLRWQEQGNHIAKVLGLPPPTWLPLPNFSSEPLIPDEAEKKA